MPAPRTPTHERRPTNADRQVLAGLPTHGHTATSGHTTSRPAVRVPARLGPHSMARSATRGRGPAAAQPGQTVEQLRDQADLSAMAWTGEAGTGFG